MSRRHALTFIVVSRTALLAASAGDVGTMPASRPSAQPAAGVQPNYLTGEGISLGGVLFPHIHFTTVYGQSSLEGGHELGAGHHDPVADGWTVQGFELGLSGRFSKHVEAFATWHGFWGNESPHRFDSEMEEYFLKLKELPGGFELRAGKCLNRFGLHNSVHLHGWDWADNYLVSGRFLGDDGLSTTGAELSWTIPLPWTSVLSFSAGDATVEEHEHEDEHEDEEGAGHEEPLFESEGAAFNGTVSAVNWTNLWNYNDFHQWRFGLSAAWGDNAWGKSTQVYGLHGQYEWRQNGFAPGGNYFRWPTEIMFREVNARTGHLPGEAPDGDDDHGESVAGSFSNWGLYTSAIYGFALGRGVLEGEFRYEYMDGDADAGLPRRHRFGPGVTWYFNTVRTAFLRGQVNFDDVENEGSGAAVWLSAGFNWGGPEVR